MTKFRKNIWAYGIILTFLVFIGLMVSMAVIASNSKENLVVTDYYKAEIEYQQQIDKIQNVVALAEKPVVSYDSINQSIQIAFPAELSGKGVDGTIAFYRPDKPEKDFRIPLQLNKEHVQHFPVNTLLKGKWRLQLNWASDTTGYYQANEINIR